MIMACQPSVRRIFPLCSARARMPSLFPPVAMNSSSKDGAADDVVVMDAAVAANGSAPSPSLSSVDFLFFDFFVSLSALLSFLSLSLSLYFFFPVFTLILEVNATKLEEKASCHQFSGAAADIASTAVADPRPKLSSRFLISILLVIPVPSLPKPSDTDQINRIPFDSW